MSSMACIMVSLSWATASMILRISGKSLRTAWKSSTCSEYRSQTVTARTLATRLDLRSRHISNSRAGTILYIHTSGRQELQYTCTYVLMYVYTCVCRYDIMLDHRRKDTQRMDPMSAWDNLRCSIKESIPCVSFLEVTCSTCILISHLLTFGS